MLHVSARQPARRAQCAGHAARSHIVAAQERGEMAHRVLVLVGWLHRRHREVSFENICGDVGLQMRMDK